MRKAIVPFVLVLALGFVLGGWTVFSVSEDRHSRELKEISDNLARSEELNRQLDEANGKLIESNSRARADVDRLERKLASDRREFEARIGGIKSTVADIASGLGGSASDIQSVIDGLRELGALIEALP